MADDPRVSWWTDLLNVPARVKEILTKMADVSAVLNDVAEKLRGPLATSIQALIAENTALRGEDAGESQATTNVVAAFGEVSDLFAPAALPDVPPLDPTV